ncbi:hypothetical protein [Tardiphaga sp.]|uniref:hypothetical protein n=1 Tax=Tardiphaga sp. TaxID=1926292 RepID=UPI0026297E22|nr:hypothetical protein [Tardiphaga sp.]MDB5620511.1 hypothetical protein [Tardiphaga sp.]
MPGIGEVEIELNGKTETLRSSLDAGKKVNAGGGYGQVLQKLAAFDQDYYVLVVAAGLGKKPSDVEHAVWKAGLPNLTEALSTYVQYLANGGKPLTNAENDGSGEA